MTPQRSNRGEAPVAGALAPKIRRLWRERIRAEQRSRLTLLQVQTCDEAGEIAWQEALTLYRELPKWVRVDLPSARVFARVLGVYRSAATLKNRPMTYLELSAAEIAKAAGYSKTVVESALRWLGSDPILYKGQQVGRGLGFIGRTRRIARAFVGGVLQNVYRTSQTGLTLAGRALLGLLPVSDVPPVLFRSQSRKAALKEAIAAAVATARRDSQGPDWHVGTPHLQELRRRLQI